MQIGQALEGSIAGDDGVVIFAAEQDPAGNILEQGAAFGRGIACPLVRRGGNPHYWRIAATGLEPVTRGL